MSRFKNFIEEELLLFYPEVFRMNINSRMMIDESINWHSAKVEIIENSDKHFISTFKSDGLNYKFKMSKVNEGAWVAEYDLSGYPNTDRGIYGRLKSGKIHNGVFAAVIKCFDEFIKIVKPKYIAFSSSDSRLIKFYQNNFKRLLLKELPLEFEKEHIYTDGSVGWLYKVIGE